VPGLVSNKPDRDRIGWDYHLDLPFPDTPSGRDLAARPSALYCKVQVKGTIGDAVSVPIKLSNLERMAKDPSPWFLAFIVVSSSTPIRAVRCYWIHIDDKLVSRVLANLQSTTKPLNQVESEIRIDADSELTPLSGTEMVTRIRAAVGTLETYNPQKVQWARAALERLASATYTVSFSYRTEKSLFRALADLAIDELSEIPLKSLSAHGQAVKKARAAGGIVSRSLLKVQAHSIARSSLELRGPYGATHLDCETRNAQRVFPFLPANYNLFKFRSRFADLIVKPSSIHAKVRLRLDQLVGSAPLGELEQAANAFRILGHPDCEIEVRALPSGASFVLRPSEPAELDQYTVILIHSAMGASWLARYFGLSPSAVHVDIQRLLSSVHRILSLRFILDSDCTADAISANTSSAVVDGTAGAILNVYTAEVGQYVLLAAGAIVGPMHPEPLKDGGYRVTITSPKPRKLAQKLLTLTQWRELDEPPAEQMLRAATTVLHDEGVLTVITGDPSFESSVEIS
jgi:hypothetical protein